MVLLVLLFLSFASHYMFFLILFFYFVMTLVEKAALSNCFRNFPLFLLIPSIAVKFLQYGRRDINIFSKTWVSLSLPHSRACFILSVVISFFNIRLKSRELMFMPLSLFFIPKPLLIPCRLISQTLIYSECFLSW